MAPGDRLESQQGKLFCVNILKTLLNNHWARKAQIYMKTFWQSAKSWPHRSGETIIGKTVFICVYIGRYLKIFFSGTTEPEKLKFTWKFSDIVQNQVSLNHGPRGLGDTITRRFVFTFVGIGKIFLKSS
jgi:hypothetical protein